MNIYCNLVLGEIWQRCQVTTLALFSYPSTQVQPFYSKFGIPQGQPQQLLKTIAICLTSWKSTRRKIKPRKTVAPNVIPKDTNLHRLQYAGAIEAHEEHSFKQCRELEKASILVGTWQWTRNSRRTTLAITKNYHDLRRSACPPDTHVTRKRRNPGEEPKLVYLTKDLTQEEENELLDFLREFLDCFAWRYIDMKGIPIETVKHTIPIMEGVCAQ